MRLRLWPVRGAAGPALTGACGAAQLASVVTVIQGTIETVSLPEQVDIIISEWMGCAPPLAAPLAPDPSGLRALPADLRRPAAGRRARRGAGGRGCAACGSCAA